MLDDNPGLTCHASPNMFRHGFSTGESPSETMRAGPNPLHVLLHRQIGIDSFAMDGDDTDVPEPWQDRPARCKTPAGRQRR